MNHKQNKNKSKPRYSKLQKNTCKKNTIWKQTAQLSSKEWQTENCLPRSKKGSRMIASMCQKKITFNLEYPSRIEKGKIKVFSDQQKWQSSLLASQYESKPWGRSASVQKELDVNISVFQAIGYGICQPLNSVAVV